MLVGRYTQCFLGCAEVWKRIQQAIQQMIYVAPKAKSYHYLFYGGSQGKTATYSVERDNVTLRHYLARLARCLVAYRDVLMQWRT